MKTQESELIKLFRNTNPYQKKNQLIIFLYVLVVLFIIGKSIMAEKLSESFIYIVIKFHRM
jgi:hypothetical protein